MVTRNPSLLILGTRGIPAAHGGFETFAERLALFLVARGWSVTVYCQKDVAEVADRITVDRYGDIERIMVEVAAPGPRGTLEFDWHSTLDAARRPGVCLVLGYNSAVMLPVLRLFGRKIVTNMDGIEWQRPKWSLPVRAWFFANEWIAAWSSHRLVADHPGIADHLATRRPRAATVMIPYGADPILEAPEAPIRALGLAPDRYLVSIARIEPDNNIALLVEAFSRRPRGLKLVVLGALDESRPYHRAVKAAAGPEVVFTGGIYVPETLRALRFHARAYLHGHTVGGTNPSLVEALWAGNAIIAHDNPFNRWTAGDAGLFFRTIDDCERLIGEVLEHDDLVARLRAAARRQAAAEFEWDRILKSYERELLAFSDLPAPAPLASLTGDGVR